MTNILKDIWDDYQRNICWLPQDIFNQSGFDLRNLSPQHYDPAFGEGLFQLIGIACHHLHNALQYILLIPRHESGIRRFCLWALGMALLTLRKIHQRPHFSTGQQVKISRRLVKTTIFVSNLAAYSDTSLRILFRLLTRSLPSYR
jgi:farnesyl-diphosphate farnesyltransferase